MTASSIITRIWDYGWLAGDELELSPTSDQVLIAQYVSSSAFQTSFLSSDKDEQGTHGPIVAGRIAAADFVPFPEYALQEYISQLLYSPDWDSPANEAQFAAVVEQLRKPFVEGMRCFLLRFDETSHEYHHEWGYIFTVFREFIFIGRRPGVVARYVIGYD